MEKKVLYKSCRIRKGTPDGNLVSNFGVQFSDHFKVLDFFKSHTSSKVSGVHYTVDNSFNPLLAEVEFWYIRINFEVTISGFPEKGILCK